ncbi:MAG: hypothetical protein ABR537_06280, partial [Gemmatimonadales bacterium]
MPLLLAALSLLWPLAGVAQAVPRTDTPRAGTLRVTFAPVITTWEHEYTRDGRQRIGASLFGEIGINNATVFPRAERRETPLDLEFGLSNRVAVTARLPVVRVRVQARHDSGTGGRQLDSLLADSTYLFA